MNVAARTAVALAGYDALAAPTGALHRSLHAAAEPAGAEERTAAIVRAALAATGAELWTGLGGHGVAARLRSGADGGTRTVLLRAELDALPVAERTGLPYAATGPCAHVCGHDVHLAAAVAALQLLADHRELWAGTVVVLAQPAEEDLTGARAVLADGLYDRVGRPDVVLAQHLSPWPVGTLAHAYGVAASGCTELRVVVHGRGGHGGAPALTVDPVVTAAAVVLRLQAVVARECDPSEGVVVTVGALHAGEVAGVVPDDAELLISIRAREPAALHRAEAAVRRVVAAEAAASGCPVAPDVEVVVGVPPVVNDEAAAAPVRAAHVAVFGPSHVAPAGALGAADDVAWLGRAGSALHGLTDVDTVFWTVGSTASDVWAAAPGASAVERLAAVPANHSPRFAPEPVGTLRTATTAAVAAVLALLPPR